MNNSVPETTHSTTETELKKTEEKTELENDYQVDDNEQNPYNNPGKWTLNAIADYDHFTDAAIHLGNDEAITISIETSLPDMDYDDFLILYDENLLKYEPFFINENLNGKTLIKYRLWSISPGESEIQVVSCFELVEKGEECTVYSLKVIGLDSKEGRVVYYTPTGDKYHFSADCAGENGMATTLWEAEIAGYEPCGKCAK